MVSISTKIQTRASEAWSQYMKEIIGLTSVILITSVMGFIASAMLLNAADTESTSDSWDTAARWIGGINIVLFAVLLGFGIYIMYRAAKHEKSGFRVTAPRWKTQGGTVKPVTPVKSVATVKPVANNTSGGPGAVSTVAKPQPSAPAPDKTPPGYDLFD